MQKPLHETRTLCLTALLAAGLTACVFALLGVWPFGGQSVLTGDLNGQYISYNAQFARALLSGESLAYSFTKQMGGTLLGILAYYCASPLNLLYLLAPVVSYAKLAALVLALKIVFSAVAAAFFFGRHTPDLRHRAILPALCYGFCAYTAAFTQNVMWLDVVMLLPLVCYGIDVLITTKRPFVFALWLGLAITANFYIAYMACFFAVLYFLWQLFYTKRTWRVRGQLCVPFAFGALCGGGLSMCLVVPALRDISATKGLAESFVLSGESSFKLTEFFYRLMPWNFDWSGMENGLPNVYCGAACVVLALCYFCAARVPLREKLASGTVLAVLFLSMYSADFALAMHGFVKPVWFLYRHAFLFSLWLCFLAARALAGAQFTLRRTALWGACLCGFLTVCFLVRNTWYTATLFGVGTLLCIAYVAGFAGLLRANSRRARGACLAVCGVLCLAELCSNTFYTMHQFEKYPIADFERFVTQGTEALQTLQARDDGAYRVEKAFFRTNNDPMLLGYHGLSHFGSTQDVNGTLWLAGMGFGSTVHYGRGSTAFAESLVGLRYLFARADDTVPAHYTPIGTAGEMLLYENPYALPLGFLASEAAVAQLPALDWNSGEVHTFDTQNTLFQALFGGEPLYTACGITAQADGAECAALGSFTAPVTYQFDVPRAGYVYAVLVSADGRPITLSGAAEHGYFAGNDAGVIQLGRHAAGETLTLTLSPDWGVMEIADARIFVLDEDLLYNSVEPLRENAAQIAWTDTSLTAHVTAQTDGVFILSVPYSQDLRLTVDGKPAEPRAVAAALCGVPLTAGEHTVTLHYAAPGTGLGLALTLGSAIALLACYVFLRERRKRI